MAYIFLTFYWPLINYININFHKLTASFEIFIIAGVLFFICILAIIILKNLLNESFDRFILLFISNISLFFNFGPIIDKLNSYNKFVFSNYFLYVVVIILVNLFLWKIRTKDNIQKFSKVFICCIVFVPLLDITNKSLVSYSDSHNKLSSLRCEFVFKQKPNVYYILVDAYARQDLLKEVFGYNNEPFLQSLENLGFIVSRSARSNYHFTAASLSATMDMIFHVSDKGKFSYAQMKKSLMGNNQVRKIFKYNGYKIVNIPSHWKEIGCFGNEDVCIRGNNFEIYESFLSTTPLKTFRFSNDYVSFNNLKKVVNSFNANPKFVFAHFAQVHDAVFDNKGTFCAALHPSFAGKEDGNRYISSIKIMNSKIIDFITELRKEDRNSVIIIQSDHGPTYTGNLSPADADYWVTNYDSMRLTCNQDFRYTFGIISAIYIPPYYDNNYEKIKKYFSGEFTLVNTFRYIFSYLSETMPNLLPENSYFLYFDAAHKLYKEDDIEQLKRKDVL